MWDSYAKGGNGYQEWQEKYRDFFFSIMDTSGWKINTQMIYFRLVWLTIIVLLGEGTIEEDEFKAINSREDVTPSECSEAYKQMSKVSRPRTVFSFCLSSIAFSKKKTDVLVCYRQNNTVINSAVFAQLWKEFFTSDDPSVPGNFIYGKLKYWHNRHVTFLFCGFWTYQYRI